MRALVCRSFVYAQKLVALLKRDIQLTDQLLDPLTLGKLFNIGRHARPHGRGGPLG